MVKVFGIPVTSGLGKHLLFVTRYSQAGIYSKYEVSDIVNCDGE